MHWALSEYVRHEKNLDVDKDYTVPSTSDWPSELWGMELGRAVEAARRLEAIALNQKDRGALPRLSRTPWGKRLTTLGFQWSRRYELLIRALTAYKKLHGDLILPRNFRVPPTPPYPSALAGVNLDRAVYSLKFYREHVAHSDARQADLRSLGFVWQRMQPEFTLIVEALDIYRRRVGGRVPVSFAVPRDDKWPPELRGMPLGQFCAQIRSRGDFVKNDPKRWQLLDRMGLFQKDTHDDALAHYQRIVGGSPPVGYVIPKDGEPGFQRWPPVLRGMPLGRRLYDAKRKHSKSDNFEAILRALETFKTEHGHVDVPQSYVTQDGLKLGSKLTDIRRGTYKSRRPQLEQLGIAFDCSRGRPISRNSLTKLREDFDDLADALQIYTKLHGHARVPADFVVPNDLLYPSHLAGLNLGSRLYTMRRNNGTLPHRTLDHNFTEYRLTTLHRLGVAPAFDLDEGRLLYN